jgi:hypothetical protein
VRKGCAPDFYDESPASAHQQIDDPRQVEVAKGKCVPKFSDVYPVPREPILFGRLSDCTRTNEMQVTFFTFMQVGFSYIFFALRVGQPRSRWNEDMSSCRIAVEWSFGKVGNIFAFVKINYNMKLHHSAVASYWLIAVMLTNCHTCLYECVISSFFGIPSPDLEE